MCRDVTADQVKDQRTGTQMKLYKGVGNWEKSGNREGNLIDLDDNCEERDVTHPDFGKFDCDCYMDNN